MGAKRKIYAKIVIFLLISILLGTSAIKAQQMDKMQEAAVLKKIQQVLDNQVELMETLKEMKEELKIIKIRATGRRG